MERVLFYGKVCLMYTYVGLYSLNLPKIKEKNNMPSAKYEIKRTCEVCGATFLAKTLDLEKPRAIDPV